ncbi:hypothetical protein, partial [Rhizobium aegyptiacum]|uniref:hypothetical protein n=1 Tax=Rhizobium aegyptiacum TaxID=1764550 RepID=UPI001ABEF4C2
VTRRAGKIAAVTFEIGKNAVTALGMKPVQFVFEKRFEIHHLLPLHGQSDTSGQAPRYLISVKFGAGRPLSRRSR